MQESMLKVKKINKVLFYVVSFFLTLIIIDMIIWGFADLNAEGYRMMFELSTAMVMAGVLAIMISKVRLDRVIEKQRTDENY